VLQHTGEDDVSLRIGHGPLLLGSPSSRGGAGVRTATDYTHARQRCETFLPNARICGAGMPHPHTSIQVEARDDTGSGQRHRLDEPRASARRGPGFAAEWRGATLLPVEVASGVPAMPSGDVEALLGALARARNALDSTGANLAVGLEGTVAEAPPDAPPEAAALYLTAGCLGGREGRTGVGAGFRLALPEALTLAVRSGAGTADRRAG
jgi:hypothetical protein